VSAFKRGDLVTILPPYAEDPIIVELQPHARVVEAVKGGYMVTLGSAWPPHTRFGPFPEARLRLGWSRGSWPR
jgi:hypothetical protein